MENEKPTGPLFSEFPPVSKDKWKDIVIKDLKGAAFEKLLWKTYEGFNIEPFYTKDDIEGLSYLKSYENISDKNAPDSRSWENREKLRVDNEGIANQLAIEALHGGATGLSFEILNRNINFDALLNSINLESTPVSFILHASASSFQKGFFSYLEKRNFPLANLKGSLEYDPVASFTLTGNYDETTVKELEEIVKSSLAAPNFYTLTINSGSFKESGASVVQELAFTLNMAAFYMDQLTDAGLTADQIASKVQFSVPIGVDYFMEMAKLKALRILFTQVSQAFGAQQFDPANIRIHAYSSLWSKTIFDPSVNLLRDTTEAMSAILGGCNSLTLEPYDAAYKNSLPFLKRIARNVASIIKEEAYLDKVVDPMAGSYYLGNLIHEITKNSWSAFQEIENLGGFMEAFKKGIIQKKIASVRDAKKGKIAGRRDVIIGTNQYPNIKESVNPVNIIIASSTSPEGIEVLVPQRAAKDFEDLRLDTEKYTVESGRKPAVYILEYGTNVTMRKARATFSVGFFATAGFNIIEDTFCPDLNAAIEKAKGVDAEIVVFCGADEDYLAIGDEFATRFKLMLKDKLLVLAGYPSDIIEKLKTAGFDEFIHVRSNAVETLRGFQKRLNVI